MIENELLVYSGRNRPDLGPAHRLFEALTGVRMTVERIYHQEVGERLLRDLGTPRGDLLLTNSQVAVERLRPARVFDPYAAPIARDYPEWLRASDFSWLSFTAWPRVAMVNRSVLPDPGEWPQRLEDFTDRRFQGAIACASLNEMTTVAQFAALRAVKGDGYTEDLIRRMWANGLHVYSSNLETRETLVRDGLAAALANSSNVHVFALDGQPVAESWLDQEPGGLGTPVEAHTVAVLRGGRNPEGARDFVDFLLSAEVQSLLARLYGETPVNASANHGWVRPLREIRRLEAPVSRLAELLESTVRMLAAHGFEASTTND